MFGLSPKQLHRLFQSKMLISDALSPWLVLRLSQIRWSIWNLNSTHATVDGRPEHTSSSS